MTKLHITRKQKQLAALVAVAAILFGIFQYTNQPKEFMKAGEVLIDPETGDQAGRAFKQQDGDTWRVFSTVRLPEPGRNRMYHGWLTEPLSGQTRYVGEFFPVQDGYSLTYSTQENIRFFTDFLVSEESEEIPEEPSNSIATWSLDSFDILPTPAVEAAQTVVPVATSADPSPLDIPTSPLPETSPLVSFEPTATPQ